MAKKKKKPSDVIKDRLNKLKKAFLSKPTLEQIGEKAAEMVKDRTRLGYGLKSEGSDKQVKLKPLSDKYKKYRKKNKPQGPSTPAKSNLTYTGEMLDSIIPNFRNGKVRILVSGADARRKAMYAPEHGRWFMGLTKGQVKELKEFIRRDLSEIIKKMNKKK